MLILKNEYRLPEEIKLSVINISVMNIIRVIPMLFLLGIVLLENNKRNKYLKIFGFLLLASMLTTTIFAFYSDFIISMTTHVTYQRLLLVVEVIKLIACIVFTVIYLLDKEYEPRTSFKLLKRDPFTCGVLIFFLPFMSHYYYCKLNEELSANTMIHKKRESFKCIILSLITFGFYDYFWLVQQNKIIQEIADEKGEFLTVSLKSQILTKLFLGRFIAFALLQKKVNEIIE